MVEVEELAVVGGPRWWTLVQERTAEDLLFDDARSLTRLVTVSLLRKASAGQRRKERHQEVK